MSGGGGFRGRGYSNRGHYNRGPNGPNSNFRGNWSGQNGGRSGGRGGGISNLPPGDPNGPRSVPNSQMGGQFYGRNPDVSNFHQEGRNFCGNGQNFQGQNFQGGGPNYHWQPNFNSQGCPPQEFSMQGPPNVNWSPHGNGPPPNFQPWCMPPQFNGPPMGFYQPRQDFQFGFPYPVDQNEPVYQPAPEPPPKVEPKKPAPPPTPQVPLLGSEEERLQKITEAADELKRKLSAKSKRQPKVCSHDNEDDNSIEYSPKDTRHDSGISNRGIPELKHDPPELNLTLNDLRDIGRVDHDNTSKNAKTSDSDDEELTIVEHSPVVRIPEATIDLDMGPDEDDVDLCETPDKKENEKVVECNDFHDDETTNAEKSCQNSVVECGADVLQQTVLNVRETGIEGQSLNVKIEKEKICRNRDNVGNRLVSTEIESIGDAEKLADSTKNRQDNCSTTNTTEHGKTTKKSSNKMTETADLGHEENQTKKKDIARKLSENSGKMQKDPNNEGTASDISNKETNDILKETETTRTDEKTKECQKEKITKSVKASVEKSPSPDVKTTESQIENVISCVKKQEEKQQNAQSLMKVQSTSEELRSDRKVRRKRKENQEGQEGLHKVETEKETQETKTIIINSKTMPSSEQIISPKTPSTNTNEDSSTNKISKDKHEARKSGVGTPDSTGDKNHERSKTAKKTSLETSSQSAKSTATATTAVSGNHGKSKTRSNEVFPSAAFDRSQHPSSTSGGSRDNFNPHIPPAFDPRLSTRERSALLTSSIPIHPEFGISQGYPGLPMANLLQTVPPINYPPSMPSGPPPPMPNIMETPNYPSMISMPSNLLLQNIVPPMPISSDLLLHPPLPTPPPLPVLPESKNSELDMMAELEEMQEAMKFADQIMNMKNSESPKIAEIDANFFHMPVFPDLPPVEPPPPPKVESKDLEKISLPKKQNVESKDLEKISLPKKQNVESKDLEKISLPKKQNVESKKLEKISLPKKQNVESKDLEKISVPKKQNAMDKIISGTNRATIDSSRSLTSRDGKKRDRTATHDPLQQGPPRTPDDYDKSANADRIIQAISDDILRPKVVFNVSPKFKKMTKPKEWNQRINDETLIVGKTSIKEASRSLQSGLEERPQSDDRRSPRDNGSLTTPILSHSRKLEFRTSTETSTSETSTSTAKKMTHPKDPEKSSSRSEELWKSRVIGRFLKMQKNDIRNMLNNSTLRKFDIAMKHLVKERKTTMSLELRNNESVKEPENETAYDRDDFMDQLSAILDSSDTVDVADFPTQFIKHLNDVLQLDQMPDMENPSAINESSPPRVVPEKSTEFDTQQETSQKINAHKSLSKSRDKQLVPVESAASSGASTSESVKASSRKSQQIVEAPRLQIVKEEPIIPEEEVFSRQLTGHSKIRKTENPLWNPSSRHASSSKTATTTSNNVAKEGAESLLNLSDLDDIFSVGIARAKKQQIEASSSSTGEIIAERPREVRALEIPKNRANRGSTESPSSSGRLAAAEIDEFFTAEIARGKLTSKKDALSAKASVDERANWGWNEPADNFDTRESRCHDRSARPLRNNNNNNNIDNEKNSHPNPEDWLLRKSHREHVAYRNLTKEEWEAKYAESPRASLEREYRAIEAIWAQGTNFSPSTFADEHVASGNVESRDSWSARSEEDSRVHSVNPTRSENRESDASSSRSSSSESNSGAEKPADSGASVSQLLKVIKEREKIGKKRTLNEEIRDEVTAEIERNRRNREKMRKRNRKRGRASARRKRRKEKLANKRRKHKSRKDEESDQESSEEEDSTNDLDDEYSRDRRNHSDEKIDIIVIKDEPLDEPLETVVSSTTKEPKKSVGNLTKHRDDSRPSSRASSHSSIPATIVSTSSLATTSAGNQIPSEARLKQMPKHSLKQTKPLEIGVKNTKIEKQRIEETKNDNKGKSILSVATETPEGKKLRVPMAIQEKSLIPGVSKIGEASKSQEISKVQRVQLRRELPVHEVIQEKVDNVVSSHIEKSAHVAGEQKKIVSSMELMGDANVREENLEGSHDKSTRPNSKTKKLDIKAYKERARLRNQEESEKLGPTKEDSRALTLTTHMPLIRKELENSSIVRQEPLEDSKLVGREKMTVAKSTVSKADTSIESVEPKKASVEVKKSANPLPIKINRKSVLATSQKTIAPEENRDISAVDSNKISPKSEGKKELKLREKSLRERRKSLENAEQLKKRKNSVSDKTEKSREQNKVNEVPLNKNLPTIDKKTPSSSESLQCNSFERVAGVANVETASVSDRTVDEGSKKLDIIHDENSTKINDHPKVQRETNEISAIANTKNLDISEETEKSKNSNVRDVSNWNNPIGNLEKPQFSETTNVPSDTKNIHFLEKSKNPVDDLIDPKDASDSTKISMDCNVSMHDAVEESLPVTSEKSDESSKMLETQTDLDSTMVPLDELPMWCPLEEASSANDRLAETMDFSSESQMFQRFPKEPIIRCDRILTEAKITEDLEFENFEKVQLGFDPLIPEEEGQEIGESDISAVTETINTKGIDGSSIPITYGDEDFANNSIETSLPDPMGHTIFSVVDDMSKENLASLENLVEGDAEDEGGEDTSAEMTRSKIQTHPIENKKSQDCPMVESSIEDFQKTTSLPVDDISNKSEESLKVRENFGTGEKSSNEQKEEKTSMPSLSSVDTLEKSLQSAETKIANKDESHKDSMEPAISMKKQILTEGPSMEAETLDKETEDSSLKNETSKVSEPMDKLIETNVQKNLSNEENATSIKNSEEKSSKSTDEKHDHGTKSKESFHSRAMPKIHKHGRIKKKSSHESSRPKHANQLTGKMIEEAVASNIVKLVSKPTSKESVMARMIAIDVEIHKLMNEKMTLYKMMESGDFTSYETEGDTIGERGNKGDEESSKNLREKIDPLSIVQADLATRLAKNITGSLDLSNEEGSKKVETKKKQHELSEERPTKKADTKKKSEESATKKPKKNEHRDKNVESRNSKHTEDSRHIARHSREKSTSSSIDFDFKSENTTKARQNQSSNVGDCEDVSREVSSQKSTSRHSPKVEKTKKKTDKAPIDPKKKETKKKSKNDVEKPSLVTKSSAKSSITDESTKNDTGRPKGLAMLEESLKPEMSSKKKLKSPHKRKNKDQGDSIDKPRLTADEAKSGLSNLLNRKKTRKKELLGWMEVKDKFSDYSQGNSANPIKLWKHVSTVIDAVAGNRTDELYDEDSSTEHDNPKTARTNKLPEQTGSKPHIKAAEAKYSKTNENSELQEDGKSITSIGSKKSFPDTPKSKDCEETIIQSSNEQESKNPEDSGKSQENTIETSESLKFHGDATHEENSKRSGSVEVPSRSDQSRGKTENEGTTQTKTFEKSRSSSREHPHPLPEIIPAERSTKSSNDDQDVIRRKSRDRETPSSVEENPKTSKESRNHGKLHRKRQRASEKSRRENSGKEKRSSKEQRITPRENRMSDSDEIEGEEKVLKRPKSANQRSKQREKSAAENREKSMDSHEKHRRSRSKKRLLERRVDSPESSSHDGATMRKQPRHDRASTSPVSPINEPKKPRGTKRKRRREHTYEEMVNCRVELIDCKYTYMNPNMQPKILRKLGLARINRYVGPVPVDEPEIIKDRTRSPPTLCKIDLRESPTIVEDEAENVATSWQETPDQTTKTPPPVLDQTVSPPYEQTEIPHETMEDYEDDDDDERFEIFKVVDENVASNDETSNREEADDVDDGNSGAFKRISGSLDQVDDNARDTITIDEDDTEYETIDELTDDNKLDFAEDAADEISIVHEVRKSTNSDETNISSSRKTPAFDTSDNEDDEEPRRTRYTVHKGPILDLKVLDDSFLAASEDGAIYRYSQTSNGILNIYKGHEAAVTCIHVLETPGKGWNLFSGSLDGTFRCYDITTGIQERPPADVGSPVQCMDQGWGIIYVGTKSGHISRYIIKSGSVKGDKVEFSEQSVLALKATFEGPRKILIVASRNKPITIRDATTGLCLRVISGYTNHTVYSLMREKNLVYCGTSSTSIPVYNFTNGEQVTQYHAGVGIVCMRLYRDILFAGCYDGNIYVFDTVETKLICSIPGPGNMLLSMEVVGDEIIAGSKNRQLHSWRMPRKVRAVLASRT